MGDFLNPVYDVVTPGKVEEQLEKRSATKPVPTPAPRPSILRKKSLPSSVKAITESKVPPITEIPDEETYQSIGTSSHCQMPGEEVYDEPVKHFPPPSYPPPKPPRKLSDPTSNPDDDEELKTIKNRLIDKINAVSDDDEQDSVFNEKKSSEINQNHLILQVPAPGIVVNVFNHVYVNNLPGSVESTRSSLESSWGQVPSSPPPPLPPRKASLDSSLKSSCHSIPDTLNSNPAITQDERLLLELSRTDSLQSNQSGVQSSPRPFQRSVTVPLDVPCSRASGSMESTSSSQHSNSSEIPSSEATDRKSIASITTTSDTFDVSRCPTAKHGYLYKFRARQENIVEEVVYFRFLCIVLLPG